jgi:TrmH family RNA methyltransferase
VAQQVIRSVSNVRVKAVAKLRRGKVAREQGLILIDGLREASRAMEADAEIIQAFVCEELLSSEADYLLSKLPAAAERIAVTQQVYEKIAYGSRTGGVVLVAKRPKFQLADVVLSSQPLVIVLENVEKPGNLGAVLRTADAVAADAVILCGDSSVDPYHANVIRASSGVVFQSQIAHAEIQPVLNWLSEHEIQIVTTLPQARRLYTDISYRSATAIVLGSEAEGLTDAWSLPSATPVKLPMRGQADSLNVSTTAAVMLFEAVRQRQIAQS